MKLKNPFYKMKKDKLILFFLVGILLVIIKLPTSSNKTKTSEYTFNSKSKITGEANTEKDIESRLEQLLSKVTGVGKTNVVITYKDTGKKIMDVEGGDKVSTKIEKEDCPEIGGVLIIAEGGDDIKVVKEITDAVGTLLGISVNRIKVLKMEA